MNIGNMKLQIPCTTCKVFKKNYDMCKEQRRCALLAGDTMILPWTKDESFEKFKSGHLPMNSE